jgi:hypothetical protein
MTQTALPNIGIDYDWLLGEDGWKTGVDDNWALLDALAQGRITVDPGSVSAQPGSPANGATYLLGSSPTGANWGARSEHDFAVYYTGTGWHFATPREGWTLYDAVNDRWIYFDGSLWRPVGARIVDETSTGVTFDKTHQMQQVALGGGNTYTIPADASDNLDVGTRIHLLGDSSGTATIQPEATSPQVTLNGAASSDTVAANVIKILIKRSANDWVMT